MTGRFAYLEAPRSTGGDPLPGVRESRVLRAISCAWGPGVTIDAERVRRDCAAAGWHLVALATKDSPADGTLGWVMHATQCTGADLLVLTRECLTDLEHEFPDLWPRLRTLLEEGGVSLVAI